MEHKNVSFLVNHHAYVISAMCEARQNTGARSYGQIINLAFGYPFVFPSLIEAPRGSFDFEIDVDSNRSHSDLRVHEPLT